MWKLDKNGINIIDPEGKVYIPGDMIQVPSIGETLPVKNNINQKCISKLSNCKNLSWNETIVKMLNSNRSIIKPQQNEEEWPKLAILFVKQIDEETAQLIEFFTDGTMVTSNTFKLPRGIQGDKGEKGDNGEKGDSGDTLWVINDNEIKPNDSVIKTLNGINKIKRKADVLEVEDIATKNNLLYKLNTEHAYNFYNTYEVEKPTFVFEDYDPKYWHYFYIYFKSGILTPDFNIVNALEVPPNLDPEYIFSNVALDYSVTSSNNIMFNLKTKTFSITKWDKSPINIIKIDVYRKLKI